MGTPVVALCGKVWVPSRAPEKFPVCPECKEIWESMKPRRRRPGTAPSDRTATSRSSRPSDSRTHSGLAGARGVGYGAAAARVADRGAHRLLRRARRATSSPSRRPAPARRRSRCRSPPSCSAAGSSTGSSSWRRPSTSSSSGPRRRRGPASRSTRRTPRARARRRRTSSASRSPTPASRSTRWRMRIRTERFKTLVILDEVHHAGDALSWGEAVREAFEPATRRLALTGTPFRSDINPIPFVTYAPGADGVPRSVADFTYGYGHALADHVVRPVLFMAYSGDLALADPRRRRGGRPARRADDQGPHRPGAAHRARPGGGVDAVGARGRRPAADRGTPPRPRRRRAGDRHRPGLRPGLRRAAEEDQRRGADGRAVRREGGVEEDRRVHRLRGPLDGGRADGVRGRRRPAARGRRLRDHDRDAALLRPGRRPIRAGPRPRRDRLGVPAVGAASARASRPRWRSSATTCSAAGSPTSPTSSPPSRTCSTGPTPTSVPPTSCEGTWQALGSQARFDRVVFDGGEFGHAGEVHVGSEEEMDFLGIPGLLEPDQMRELLHHRQRSRRTTAAPRRPTERAGVAPTSSWRSCAASSTAWSPPGTTAPARPTASPTPPCARSSAARPPRSRTPSSSTPGSTASASGRRGRTG